MTKALTAVPADMEDRAETNRQNASHSTGPRTQSGKKRARDNARQHGFAAAHSAVEARSAEVRELSLAICGINGTRDERAQADIIAHCEVTRRMLRNHEILVLSGIDLRPPTLLEIYLEQTRLAMNECRRRGLIKSTKAVRLMERSVKILNRLQRRSPLLTTARLKRYERQTDAREMAAVRELARLSLNKKLRSRSASPTRF